MSRSPSPRREFLRFLAGSPFAASALSQDSIPTLAGAKDAMNVMDFEPLARKALPPAHWGYLATGVDDVFINGVQVLKGGKHTGAKPGRFVRGPGWTGWPGGGACR